LVHGQQKKWLQSLIHPYSLNLPPCEFFLFLKKKLKIKGKIFNDALEIQEYSQQVFNDMKEEM
jgi:hypothetical protein